MLSVALINLAFSFSAFSEVVAITFVCTLLSVSPGGSKYLSLLECQLLSDFFQICFLISVSEQKKNNLKNDLILIKLSLCFSPWVLKIYAKG